MEIFLSEDVVVSAWACLVPCLPLVTCSSYYILLCVHIWKYHATTYNRRGLLVHTQNCDKKYSRKWVTPHGCMAMVVARQMIIIGEGRIIGLHVNNET